MRAPPRLPPDFLSPSDDGEARTSEGRTEQGTSSRAYRTFLFCPLCLASFLSLLVAQLVLGKRLDQEGKCLELMSFFRILNTPREFFVGSRRKLINMLRSVQNIHVETAYGGLSQVHWPSVSSLPGRQAYVPDPPTSATGDARVRPARQPIAARYSRSRFVTDQMRFRPSTLDYLSRLTTESRRFGCN